MNVTSVSIRSVAVVVLAIAFGLSAVWGVIYLRQPVHVEVEPETAPVVVAAVNIPRGHNITEEDLKNLSEEKIKALLAEGMKALMG